MKKMTSKHRRRAKHALKLCVKGRRTDHVVKPIGGYNWMVRRILESKGEYTIFDKRQANFFDFDVLLVPGIFVVVYRLHLSWWIFDYERWAYDWSQEGVQR